MMTKSSNDSNSEPDSYHQLAAFIKAAGDPLRLEILRVLARDSYGVLELSHIFNIKQSGMSHHLKVLATAGLVATRREGNSIFYRRAMADVNQQQAELQEQLYSALDKIEIRRETVEQLSHIQASRTETSKQFFTENAAKFREQQDLIASYPVYAEQMQELLIKTPLPSQQCALEVGPGEGEFLSILSTQFHQVIALDNSRSMLDKASAYTAKYDLENIAFICGESKDARKEGITADCIVINMVLHHTPSPAQIFQDCCAILRPGGALLITDLCHHDQSWARETCGDIWLGFEPEDFSNWAAIAGLQEGHSVYFALRNGFQIQLRQFFKPN